MKEKAFDRYRHGEKMTGMDFANEPDCYETIFYDMRTERSVAQFDLWGEIHFQRREKYLDKDPEVERLCRPVLLKNGENKIISSWGRYGN